jgi:antitoxin (DNA-binding transcriptional repressor) of toxin-antitoxin stability system
MDNKVDVQQLIERPTELMARVKQGESIAITELGREIAVISPPKLTWLDQMIASGLITPASGDLGEWLRNNPPASDASQGVPSEEIIAHSRRERI